jgi:hypothetical protein
MIVDGAVSRKAFLYQKTNVTISSISSSSPTFIGNIVTYASAPRVGANLNFPDNPVLVTLTGGCNLTSSVSQIVVTFSLYRQNPSTLLWEEANEIGSLIGPASRDFSLRMIDFPLIWGGGQILSGNFRVGAYRSNATQTASVNMVCTLEQLSK